jgi:hypothetical protein
MHWQLCLYRPTCDLHFRNSDSSLDPTRISILTHAPPIRSSTTQKELSYNVPMKLLKHLNTFPRIWLSNLFLFSAYQTKFCSHDDYRSGSVCEWILLSWRQNTLQKFALNSLVWRVTGASLPSWWHKNATTDDACLWDTNDLTRGNWLVRIAELRNVKMAAVSSRANVNGRGDMAKSCGMWRVVECEELWNVKGCEMWRVVECEELWNVKGCGMWRVVECEELRNVKGCGMWRRLEGNGAECCSYSWTCRPQVGWVQLPGRVWRKREEQTDSNSWRVFRGGAVLPVCLYPQCTTPIIHSNGADVAKQAVIIYCA